MTRSRLVAAAGAATVVNVGLFAFGSVAGATWATSSPVAPSPALIAAVTIIPILLAGAITGALGASRPRLRRLAPRAGLVFGIAGAPVPFLASSDVTTSLFLASMHVAAGIVWFLALRPGLEVTSGAGAAR
ncbi:MAG: hypothetical protein RL338_1435 [Chloroflexota bacterium]|jgi:hypothetical protein